MAVQKLRAAVYSMAILVGASLASTETTSAQQPPLRSPADPTVTDPAITDQQDQEGTSTTDHPKEQLNGAATQQTRRLRHPNAPLVVDGFVSRDI
jgi:hypothetical protein